MIQNGSNLHQPPLKQTATFRISTPKSSAVDTQTKFGQPMFGAAPILSSRFENALHLANQLHQTQLRKGTEIPYFAHLMGVASLVLEHGGNEEEAIAGILHDAVEDQGGKKTLQLIREQFGDTVADIVMGCTDADVIPKPPWKARKEAYIAHVATASPSVRLVSACDKLHNARAILSDYYQNGDHVWDKFKGGKEGTLWYYRSLVTEFKKHGDSPLLQELDRTVTQLERLAQKTETTAKSSNILVRAWQQSAQVTQNSLTGLYQGTLKIVSALWQFFKSLFNKTETQAKSN